MENIISELWYGRIRPTEKTANAEILELENLLSRNYHDLMKTLDEEQKSIFEKYTENASENLCLNCEKAFYDGFCLCAKLLTEALS
ncbi:MAG: hypothetical protein IJA06_03715 [Oscillospiraceae bacterium]|nr:hypothetical protein [Oscillospiraceae bacterium]